jgi:hypothetical protein
MTASVQRLIGVYDADHTLRGELSYFVGARLGRSHCALCDITHGLVRPRSEWQQCQAELPVPFETFHRDDQPADVRTATDGAAPVVVAETAAGLVTLLDARALEACQGSIEQMQAAVEHALEQNDLTWPDA